VSDGTRTRDILDHNQVLYQAELHPPCGYFTSAAKDSSGSAVWGQRSGT
jgi:hypothetical protein